MDLFVPANDRHGDTAGLFFLKNICGVCGFGKKKTEVIQ
jgi:hypothetical protein